MLSVSLHNRYEGRFADSSTNLPTAHKRVLARPRRICCLRWIFAVVLVYQSFVPASSVALQSAVSSSTHAATMNDADRTALSRALAAYDRGQPEQAMPVLRELVRKYPGNFDATETLGLIHAEAGDFSSALPLLEKACHIRASSALAQANLGTAYIKLNRINDALHALKRAAALDPHNAQTQSALGQALMSAGHPAEAAGAFAAANAEGHPDPDLVYNWALALFDAGNTKRASEVLARISDKESSAQVESLWGDIEEKNLNHVAALRHFETAAKLDPSEANIDALGKELTRHWTFATAIRIFEYGVAKYPASTRLRLGLAVAEYANDDYPGSAAVLAALLDAEPENRLYADLLGKNCILLGTNNSNCDKLIELAARHPSNAAAALYAAEMILRQPQGESDTSRAGILLKQAMAADPTLVEAFFQMGILDQRLMHWQESAAMLQKAVALQPSYAQAHYQLARAYSHLGKREQALEEIKLQQEYSHKNEDSRNARMREVTKFLVIP